METMEKKQIIGSVGILDIRSASEQTISRIERIGSVGCLLYSQETKDLLTRLNIGSLGSTIVASPRAKMLSGQETLTRESFRGLEEPMEFVLAGQLIFEPDIPEEDIRSGLKDIVVSGQIICPKHLAGAIRSRVSNLSGQIVQYEGHPKLIFGTLDLDNLHLASLKDDTGLLVFGRVRSLEVLDNDLIRTKLCKLQVFGKMTCRGENAGAFQSRFGDLGVMGRLSIIPEGFEPIERELTLDQTTIKRLPGRRIHCARQLVIDASLTADALTASIERIISTSRVICPSNLADTLAQVCDVLATRVLYYDGALWLVDGEMTLIGERFDYLEGKATLVVTGELLVDEGIEPGVLSERIERVHNLGEIKCSRPQMAALQSKLATDDGEFKDSQEKPAAKAPKDPNFDRIGSVGELKL